VDDGIAAGFMMRAVIAALRRHRASWIVVAVPTAHRSSLEVLAGSVEAINCQLRATPAHQEPMFALAAGDRGRRRLRASEAPDGMPWGAHQGGADLPSVIRSSALAASCQ
jgi:hypothetical protein